MAKSLKKSSKPAAVAGGDGAPAKEVATEGPAAKPSRSAFAAVEFLLPWAFFPLFFALCLLANPMLQYQSRSPAFYWEASFFRGFLLRPGGPAEYAATFLLQFHTVPWIGAALQTCLAMAVYLLFRGVLRQVSRRTHPFLALAPVAFLLPLQCWPDSPVLATELGLLFSLACLAVYGWARPFSPATRAVAIVGLALSCYFLSGGFLLVLAALGFLLALCGPKIAWMDMALWTLMAATIPYASTIWPYFVPVRLDYLRLLTFTPQWTLTALLASFPVAMLSGVLLRRLNREPMGKGDAAISSDRELWEPVLAMAVVLVLAAGLFFGSFDRRRLILPQLGYHARHGQWAQVLQEARRVSQGSLGGDYAALVCASIDTTRALYHQGRMCSDFFSYWWYDNNPLLPSTSSFIWSLQMAEVLFELGQVNYAEHWAHEAIELQGDRPELLVLLSKINRLLDRPRAAATFLNRMRENPFHREAARIYLEDLNRDPLGTNNAELSSIRALMPTNDAPSVYLSLDSLLHQVLRVNPKNRMAYEYLMIHYLLNRNLDEAVGLTRGMIELGFKSVPAHIEEAFLLYAREKKLKVQKIVGIPISEQTLKRYDIFDKVVSSHDGRSDLLVVEMQRQFPGSYWDYYVTETIKAGLTVK